MCRWELVYQDERRAGGVVGCYTGLLSQSRSWAANCCANCHNLVFAVQMLAGNDKIARHRFCEA